MASATTSRVPPRWKVILAQLRAELPEYSYGSSYHTITDLCAKFSVSTITAIRVLNELAKEGLIEKIPGKGNIVRRLTRTAHIRLINPAQIRRDYMTFDPVIRRLVEGVSQSAAQQGIDFNTISEAHLQSLFPRPGETFGFLVARGVSRQTSEFLRAHNLPHVFLDPLDGYKGLAHARSDRVESGYLATRHLLDLGHRRIAWITGPISRRNFRARIHGYRRALREAGIPFKWSLIKETSSADGTHDVEALDELLQRRPAPTAIITGDDSRAIHVLDACRARGLDVPGDLSVLGYPNNPESSLTKPPLSVIDAHYEKVSAAAVQLLLAQMLERAEPASQASLIAPALVQRESTGPVPRRPRSAPVPRKVPRTPRPQSSRDQ